MTFCGELLNAPAGCYLHPFESRSPQGRKRARPGAGVRGERSIFSDLMERSGMAGKNLSRKAPPALDSQAGCACLSPGERTQKGEKTRHRSEQVPAATSGRCTRNDVAPYSPASVGRGALSAGHGAIKGRRDRNGRCKPALASGWKPAARRAGRRQRSWLSAKHDSRPDARCKNRNVQKPEKPGKPDW